MDTPEKAPTGSPMVNIEESPFSNFINSLSPIKPSKMIRISHTFGSLSFSSPPSVFTSPQINLPKESRFLKRDQLLELAKPEPLSDNENDDAINEDAGKTDNWHINSRNVVEELKPCKNESSEFQPAPSFGGEIKSESDTPYSSETDKSRDGLRCDWDNVVFDAADLLIFESPQQGVQKDHPEKLGDENIDVFASLLPHVSDDDDDMYEIEQRHGTGPLNSDVIVQSKDQVSQLAQANKLKQIYQGQQDNGGSSSSNGSFTGQTSKILENKPALHHGIRRRCLVFEIPGAKKSVNDGSISTASSSQDEQSMKSSSKQPEDMQRGDSPMHVRSGIGLHLNAIALASRGHRVLTIQNSSFDKQLIPAPGSDQFQSLAPISSQDFGDVESELQTEEDASAYGVHEDLNPSSPKKKRRRTENSGEGDSSCKRCNCKKSKCLKLYCECFAAGVYCVEPCACQDCFNKPIHEETVLATRKQIESRNPLAFAPKVIRTSESVNDFVDDSNRTPASARHKRGCNCKKSNCLKKYCECFQGGVGCSIGCRCEGCKNTFGRKDGLEMALDMEEDTPNHENSTGDNNTLVQPQINNDDEINPIPFLHKTPLRLFRSPMLLPSTSNGKPPRFGCFSSRSLLNHYGTGRSTFLRLQHKADNKHPQNPSSGDDLPVALHNTSPNSSVKTLSPNSKRITPPNHDNLGQPSPGLRTSRKLILQSIPSFPSLTPPAN